MVLKDLEDLKIYKTFQEMEQMSKYKFKKFIRDACHKFAFKYLIEEKNKLSKGKQIVYERLETQNYLMPGSELSQDDSKQIYLLRTNNFMVKCNFPGMYKDKKCISELCSEEDSTRHIFYCKYLENKNEQCISIENISYEDIYSKNTHKQLIVKNIFMKKFNTRNKIFSSK